MMLMQFGYFAQENRPINMLEIKVVEQHEEHIIVCIVIEIIHVFKQGSARKVKTKLPQSVIFTTSRRQSVIPVDLNSVSQSYLFM